MMELRNSNTEEFWFKFEGKSEILKEKGLFVTRHGKCDFLIKISLFSVLLYYNYNEGR